jgi:hypothetical protein
MSRGYESQNYANLEQRSVPKADAIQAHEKAMAGEISKSCSGSAVLGMMKVLRKLVAFLTACAAGSLLSVGATIYDGAFRQYEEGVKTNLRGELRAK